MSQHFRGWGLLRLLASLDQAVKGAEVELRQTPPREDDDTVERLVMGVDVGGPDMTAVAALRGRNLDVVIIDDPYAEAHTFEGEFREILEAQKIAPARNVVTWKGPQPRTKYPRRR